MTNLSTNNILSFMAVFCSFLLLTLTVNLITASPKPSDAVTSSASAGSSVYYASISNDDTVSIPITPTSTQTEYTTSSNITFSNTCTAGSYVYINTSSNTNNSLTRTGSDSGVKTIDAVAGASGLEDNTWGFKVDGKAFSQVPLATAPAVLYSSSNIETNKTIPITYGVKLDNTVPSGTYSNDVVYTVVVDNRCLQYTLSFKDEDGTTSLFSDINVNYGDNVNLGNYIPTKSGYTFAGWSNGSNIYTGNTNPNPTNDMTLTLKAKWTIVDYVKNFSYTGGEQMWTVPYSGYYKLEVWGASGGGKSGLIGGYGSYSTGVAYSATNSKYYINVGGAGQYGTTAGYNGGGTGTDHSGSGGGATHIAKSSGLLATLSAKVSDILIVAGAGGGASDASNYSCTCQIAAGSHSGGIQGNHANYDGCYNHSYGSLPTGGSQTTGGKAVSLNQCTSDNGSFGKGSNACTAYNVVGGGGGGYYGGTVGSVGNNCNIFGGTGGSGYIGSSNLISGGGTTKHMTCYSCTTSSDADTRTYSNTNVSATPTADYSKTGNGYARITYLGTSI